MCDIKSEAYNQIFPKGQERIAECAAAYEHESLLSYLRSSPKEIFAHERCRKKYVDPREINKHHKSKRQDEDLQAVKRIKLRSDDIYNY